MALMIFGVTDAKAVIHTCSTSQRPRPLGLYEEAVGVVEEEFSLRIFLEARPGDDVVDRLRKLAFRVGIVGGIHQYVFTQEMGDVIEHVLAFVVFDAAEEPAALHVFARLPFEGSGAADIDRLLVHAPGPEW